MMPEKYSFSIEFYNYQIAIENQNMWYRFGVFCSGLFGATLGLTQFKNSKTTCDSSSSSSHTSTTLTQYEHTRVDQHSALSEFESTNLQPGFKSIFFYKLFNLDFHEMKRPEVLIELGLISLPLIAGGVTSYKVYYSWKYKYFYNTINVTLNTIRKEHNYSHNYYSVFWHTILERQINEAITNPRCIRALIKAGKKVQTWKPQNLKNVNNNNNNNNNKFNLNSYVITTDMIDAHTYDIICNNLVNMISPLSAQSFLHNDILSLPNSVINENYLMVLTCEYNDNISYKNYFINNKIRVQLIKESVIEELLQRSKNWRDSTNSNSDSINSNNGCKINWKYKLGTRYQVIEQILNIYEEQMEEYGGIRYGRPLWPIELSTRVDVNEKREYETSSQINPIATQGRDSNTAKYYQFMDIIQRKQFNQLSQQEKRMTYREFDQDKQT